MTNNIINTPLITLGGAFTMTGGAFTFTGTLLGNTAVTFPTSGTLLSTSSYPAPGATAGKIVISNGTAWIASTSIFPNTVATAGKILRSDGTVNAYTTSTFADTYSVSTILYASSANVITGLATANSSVLTTSAGGVPTWLSQLTVPIGGTGAASFTAYSVICGGTTSTGTLQNVVGVGTAAQVLVSNGAGALPSWKSIGAGTDALNVVAIQVFTSNGTYTPTTDMTYCIIECLGAGGGGGGAVSASANSNNAGGGGGAGNYSRIVATAATIGASQVVTIGAAGAAGTAGNNAGGNGGDTSLGAICIGKGGTGGGGSAAGSFGAGGAGGVAGTGTLTIVGNHGGDGLFSLTAGAFIFTGAGANSLFGSGPGTQCSSAATVTGRAASGYGSGGNGGGSSNAGGNAAGGAGTAGLIIITEFIST